MKRLVIIGASGHGKVIGDIAAKVGYEEILFLDDNPNIGVCGGKPVVGNSREIAKYAEYAFIVAIGNGKIRQRVQEEIEKQNLYMATLIHPSAVIAESVVVQSGTVIMAGSVINSGTTIGKGCIINTCSSVDHDCVVSDYVHVSVGSHVAGAVNIGSRTWIGAGATVSNSIDVTSDCMIGAGAVVVKNISKPGTYVGVPAKEKLMDRKLVCGGG